MRTVNILGKYSKLFLNTNHFVRTGSCLFFVIKPCYEQRIIDKLFARLIRENDLRPVVFHSLRHCSISLMLKLSGGDVKAVQGNSGHAESRMVTDTYAHSFDTDRKLLAQEIDNSFFAKLGTEPKTEEPDAALLDKLKVLIRDNPQLVQALLANANDAI